MSILFCKLYVNFQKIKLLKELDRQTFTDCFTSKQDCYELLAELKWSHGYNCKQCHSNTYTKKQPASRRCSKCGYDESTTTGTLFH